MKRSGAPSAVTTGALPRPNRGDLSCNMVRALPAAYIRSIIGKDNIP